MKNGNIPWFGEIPKDWEVNKLNRISETGSGTTPKANSKYYDGNIYWLNTGDLNDSIITNLPKTITEKALEDYSVLRVYNKKSIVIAMYGATIGKLGILDFETTTNQACCVINCNKSMEYKFIFYVLFVGREYILSFSVGSGQPNINQDTIKQFQIPIPPFNEQQEIVRYLDKKCGEIDITIEKTKVTIEKYKKLKQSIITEAVTKGLKQDVPMRDSGIEWIGQIPEGWEVKRIKNIAKVCNDKNENLNLKYIGLENIESWTGKYIESESSYDISQALICNENNIIFGKLRPYLAKTYFVPNMMLCSSEFAVFEYNKCPRFLYYILQSHFFINIVDSSTYGTKMPRANIDFIGNVNIALPSIPIQRAIVDFLDKKTAIIDDIITKKEALLEKLTGYKKSLIYEAVTGKLEV